MQKQSSRDYAGISFSSGLKRLKVSPFRLISWDLSQDFLWGGISSASYTGCAACPNNLELKKFKLKGQRMSPLHLISESLFDELNPAE
jgi:hypothetical protein